MEIQMKPHSTALVLIEYQNDFVSEGGVQHDAVKGVMASTSMLANSIALLKGARAAGISILHVPIAFAEGYPEVPANPYGILAGVVASNAFRKGSWGAEIAAEMQPIAGEIIVEGKRGLIALPAPISTSSYAPAALPMLRSPASSRTVAWNRRCARPTSAPTKW
jgi:nicotinamidase-related amidase